ncbi:hypothetical protein AVEN_194993-1 [Araneus ventricosus]|uniref:Uncharacterized protein n=1 Tax=Araneus ventricosus TaxID=182803 RepID=A0A4Y2HPW8_ARAVE|nr:hypothetical protein AVEN_194993-1 [Araneus ventricosus]
MLSGTANHVLPIGPVLLQPVSPSLSKAHVRESVLLRIGKGNNQWAIVKLSDANPLLTLSDGVILLHRANTITLAILMCCESYQWNLELPP